MVCIYCSGPTFVTNSRLQKQLNQVWRRRHCELCNAIFSTHEAPQLSGTLMFRSSSGALSAFSRDKLFLSIHDSCKHRKDAIEDASALTLNIIGKLSGFSATGEILREELIGIVMDVLTKFDSTAANVFAGLHSS
jgi:transcriptional regulator NrdR family protein